jgi:hypothetical protein
MQYGLRMQLVTNLSFPFHSVLFSLLSPPQTSDISQGRVSITGMISLPTLIKQYSLPYQFHVNKQEKSTKETVLALPWKWQPKLGELARVASLINKCVVSLHGFKY